MAGRSPWPGLSFGPDAEAGERAGKQAATVRFPTTEDFRIGLSRVVACGAADLHRLGASHAGERSRLRGAERMSQRRACLAAADQVREREGTDAWEKARGERAPRAGHRILIGVLGVLAVLEAIVNYSVFQVLALGPIETRLVALGVQILVTYAGHELGSTLGTAVRATRRPILRALGHAVPWLVTVASLVAAVAYLSVVRGDVFTSVLFHGDGVLDIEPGVARNLFAALTALLTAVAVDVGFAFGTSASPVVRRAFRRAVRSGRNVRKADRAGERTSRRRIVVEEKFAQVRRVHDHTMRARRDQWEVVVHAFAQGFRAAAPVDMLLDLDAVSLPRIELPTSPRTESDEESDPHVPKD